MKKRSGFAVMAGLIGMVRPLIGYMILAILMGVVGNLFAISITIVGGMGILQIWELKILIPLLLLIAILRGLLRYGEQACNHFIAFKLLARIRHKVFAALRRLAPAKLEGREKGNLISLITSDIELLEVFYAHTISPIAIAVITSVIMVIYIGANSVLHGAFAGICYLLVGAVIPMINGRAGSVTGQNYRKEFGNLNTVCLDNLYGLDEIIQYQREEERLDRLDKATNQLEEHAKILKNKGTKQVVSTNTVILLAGVVAMMMSVLLIQRETLSMEQATLAVIAMMSSFGPTAALSALSNNLNQTLASGGRVLSLLEEEPIIDEIVVGESVLSGDISLNKVSFSYPKEVETNEEINEQILQDFSAHFTAGKIHGIHGASGCGKSTMLKLLMRFFETNQGEITYAKQNINQLVTKDLRNRVSYVTQETFLLSDTIEANIRLGNMEATYEEVIEAAKSASIHDFIQTLPQGYQTRLAELGDSVSGGERQRIGLARAFLHNGDYLYLDEPTSNIDSLNESIILKSLYERKEGKTILLVSHRESTMGICDDVLEL